MFEVDQLRDVAEKFLAKRSPRTRVIERVSARTPEGIDRSLWLAEAELGWTGVLFPEALGGTDLGYQALGALVESSGRFLVLEPVLSSLCLASPILQDSGIESRTLESVVAGTTTVTVAVPDKNHLFAGTSPICGAAQSNQLKGTTGLVLDYPDADWVIVPVNVENDLAWLLFAAEDKLALETGMILDGRQACRLQLDSILMDSSVTMIQQPEKTTGYQPYLSRWAALLSSWQLGAMTEVFEVTLEHLRNRVQFGVPIGSFQALQHRMAALYCELSVARSLVESALSSLDEGSNEASLFAHAAKAKTGELALRLTGEAIQMHGGMGMTEEAGIGIFYKSARVVDWLAGDHGFHLEQLALLRGVEPVH